ncbi:MAG: hypothetical protein IPH05_01650 [Flavobacteriales bacterium]|jgi:antitoxin component YwqK of YwqJK toxin-antitoxin module|nr:hypothetical protein [Flavobacteriales bacterium]MBK6550186.1 hypothetical protein [Flavobacteriales bacterium]MBK6881652.1 hypothetical protein [Flavobacteriales bacterium]MBK7103543.1 hypothetical protein [Flavobacteriales bacterium]MBK7113430.1 hypothetical protein [Flavobacteriales bacterium]
MIRIAALVLITACVTPAPEGQKVVVDTSAIPPSADGSRVIHLPDGGRMEGELANGERTGTWSSFFADSTLRSRSEYVEGLEEGPTTVYHPNGQRMYTGSYLHGQPFGEWIYYGPGGKELKRVVHDSTGVVVR